MAATAGSDALSGSIELRDDANIPQEPSETAEKAFQVMQIDLARDTVQEMRRAVKAGAPMSIGFGKHLWLRYGRTHKTLRIRPTKFPEKMYYREPSENVATGQALTFAGTVSHHIAQEAKPESTTSSSAAADEALSRMKEKYAAIQREKLANQTTIRDEAVDPLKNRRAKVGNHLRPSVRPAAILKSSTNTHLSPNLTSSTVSSDPSSGSSRAQRFVLIHLLAVRPILQHTIQSRTGIQIDVLEKLLDVLAENKNSVSGSTWTLTTKRYRELDPWAFPYQAEDRSKAIDNAIHALDKLRLNPADKLWQLLLPPHERGKGKTLSRLSQFPTDHRKLLSGLEGQKQSHPGSPAHTQSAEQSETESTVSVRKQPKKPDLIANAKKRLAGRDKVDKPAKQEKPVEKKAKAEDKKLNGTSLSDGGGKKRKVLSDERVHSSDDESLAPSAKVPKVERARAVSCQAETEASTISKKLPVKDDSLATKASVNPTERQKMPAAKSSSSSIKADSLHSAEAKSKKGESAQVTSGAAKRQSPENGPQPPTAKRAKTSAATEEKSKYKEVGMERSESAKSKQAASSHSVSNDAKRFDTDRPGCPSASAKKVKASHPASQPDEKDKASQSHKKDVKATPSKLQMSTGTPKGSPSSVAQPKRSPYDSLTPAKKVQALNTSDRDPSPKNAAKAPADMRIKEEAKPSPKPSPVVQTKAKIVDGANKLDPISPDEPLTRRQTFNLYRQYHKYFSQYKSNLSDLEQRPEKILDNIIKRTETQYNALKGRQESLIKGFVAMLEQAKRDLSANPDAVVRVDDRGANSDKTGVMSEVDSEKAKTALKKRFEKWTQRYADFVQNLGAWSPENAEELWSDLDGIRDAQRNISRAQALKYGAKKEGNLKDVVLEQ